MFLQFVSYHCRKHQRSRPAPLDVHQVRVGGLERKYRSKERRKKEQVQRMSEGGVGAGKSASFNKHDRRHKKPLLL